MILLKIPSTLPIFQVSRNMFCLSRSKHLSSNDYLVHQFSFRLLDTLVLMNSKLKKCWKLSRPHPLKSSLNRLSHQISSILTLYKGIFWRSLYQNIFIFKASKSKWRTIKYINHILDLVFIQIFSLQLFNEIF